MRRDGSRGYRKEEEGGGVRGSGGARPMSSSRREVLLSFKEVGVVLRGFVEGQDEGRSPL